jgi:ERF superfamily
MKLITAALITAKAQFNPIHKNKVNPHFKSKYATLDEILEAIAPALLANNLLLIQPTLVKDNLTVLKTLLIHAESGEQLASELTIPAIADPQKLGAAMTYYRRFSVCSLLAIAPDDDDDGTTAKATTTVKTTSSLPKAVASSGDERLLSQRRIDSEETSELCASRQTASRSTVNREVELRELMKELKLPDRTITELVQRHFGIDRRIGSMTPAEFEQLLTLMRQTANLEANNNHQTNGVVR